MHVTTPPAAAAAAFRFVCQGRCLIRAPPFFFFFPLRTGCC